MISKGPSFANNLSKNQETHERKKPIRNILREKTTIRSEC